MKMMVKKKALSRAEAGKESNPYPHMNLFLMRYLCYKWSSFEFLLILLIAQVSNNSLFFVALGGLFVSCVSPSSVMDKWFTGDRMVGITRAMVISIFTGGSCIVLCLALLLSSYITGQSTARLLYVLPVLFAIHILSNKIISRSIENDWCQVFSDGDTDHLLRTESRIQRLGLIGASIAPILIGTVATQSLSFAAILLGIGHVVATLVLWRHLGMVYVNYPALGSTTNVNATTVTGESVIEKTAVVPASGKNESALMALAAVLGERDEENNHGEIQITLSPLNDSENGNAATETSCAKCCNKCIDPSMSIQNLTHLCAVVIASGCVGTIMASSCLSLTVLSMGSVLAVYLRWTGLSDYGLGILYGLAVVAGGLGGMSFPFCKGRCGGNTFVLGRYALLVQSGCAGLAATCVYMLIPFTPALGDVLIGSVILFSHFVQKLFQLSAQEIVYQKVSDDNVRTIVMSYWHGLVSICTIASFVAAIILPDGATFSYLAMVSAACSLCGSAMFILSPICCKLCCQALGDKMSPHGSDANRDSTVTGTRANARASTRASARAGFTELPMSSEHGHSHTSSSHSHGHGQGQGLGVFGATKGTTSDSNGSPNDDNDDDDEFEAAMNSGGTLNLPSRFTIHHPDDEDDD